MKKLEANGVIEESIIEQICCNSNKGKASKMSVESNWIEEEQETENLISLFCSLSEKQRPPQPLNDEPQTSSTFHWNPAQNNTSRSPLSTSRCSLLSLCDDTQTMNCSSLCPTVRYLLFLSHPYIHIYALCCIYSSLPVQFWHCGSTCS